MMSKPNPAISVVMSVYNSERYLAEAIESILTQTFTDFEFIIINDGSVDSSLAIIESYMAKDVRIVLISRENKGLPASLNEGIAIAKGKYIARMDADDVSLPFRFEKQIAYIKSHGLDVCGTNIRILDNTKEWHYPQDDNSIKFSLLFFSSFAHPTVIFNKKIFDSLQYDPNYVTAQDYKLWTDIALCGFKLGNLDLVTLLYRMHLEQISSKKSLLQKEYTLKIGLDYVEKYRQEFFNVFSLYYHQLDCQSLKSILNIILAERGNVGNDIFLLKMMRHMLGLSMQSSNRLSIRKFMLYRSFSKKLSPDTFEELILLFKCLNFFDKNAFFYKKLKMCFNR